MKTDTKILLYDDYCPLCTWYSNLFVKFGFLRKENRIAFSNATIEFLEGIDIERGKNEIPLFDTTSKKTLYGIDALLEILSEKCIPIKKIGNTCIINWFLRKLYKLISYNRKVIVAKKCNSGAFDCSPYVNMRYRVVFMLLFFVFNTLMLIPLHKNLFTHLSFYHLSLSELQAAHLVLVLSNCIIASHLKKQRPLNILVR